MSINATASSQSQDLHEKRGFESISNDNFDLNAFQEEIEKEKKEKKKPILTLSIPQRRYLRKGWSGLVSPLESPLSPPAPPLSPPESPLSPPAPPPSTATEPTVTQPKGTESLLNFDSRVFDFAYTSPENRENDKGKKVFRPGTPVPFLPHQDDPTHDVNLITKRRKN